MEILIVILVLAVITDIFCYRIPNEYILTGMITGLVLTTLEHGGYRMLSCIIQMLILMLALFPFYMIKGIGAGDIKLLMMVGCFMERSSYIHSLATAFIIAGLISIVKIVTIQDCRERLKYLCGYIRKVILTKTVDNYKVERSNRRTVIRMSIPVLCSVLLMYGGFYS